MISRLQGAWSQLALPGHGAPLPSFIMLQITLLCGTTDLAYIFVDEFALANVKGESC